ncbi:hypothetical protein HG543_48800 [Pyxidicoccus fallax]|uniref:Uncharacterized protein n=3 Tax=Pyxidicoccus fallax TaxID=394095 RepID=A0A848LY05_9BACT|nr:hypothetical protein [Pyxidicoccus fallax]NMO22706.1 hypothetical protein [Pyxidicoccus fallax]
MTRWLPLALLLLPACALFHRPPRPVHAPPEEAARFSFPETGIPEEGLRAVPGAMVRAIQLAMEDFYPWDKKPPTSEGPEWECLYRRESYGVYAAPYQDDVILVSIVLEPQACGGRAVPHDMGALYAVDTRSWRILAVQR